jgi:hypothetical protein
VTELATKGSGGRDGDDAETDTDTIAVGVREGDEEGEEDEGPFPTLRPLSSRSSLLSQQQWRSLLSALCSYFGPYCGPMGFAAQIPIQRVGGMVLLWHLQ